MEFKYLVCKFHQKRKLLQVKVPQKDAFNAVKMPLKYTHHWLKLIKNNPQKRLIKVFLIDLNLIMKE